MSIETKPHIAELENVQADNEKLRSWIKAAHQFAWAHEHGCPGYKSGGSACTCGLDQFLGRPKLFIESYKQRIAELEAQAASQAKLIAGYIGRQIDDQQRIAEMELELRTAKATAASVHSLFMQDREENGHYYEALRFVEDQLRLDVNYWRRMKILAAVRAALEGKKTT